MKVHKWQGDHSAGQSPVKGFLFFLFLLIFLKPFDLLQLPFSSFFSLTHSGIIPLSWFLPSQISPYREPSRTIPRRNKWGIYSSFSPPGQDLEAHTLSPDPSRQPELIFQTARSRTIPPTQAGLQGSETTTTHAPWLYLQLQVQNR